MYVESRQMELDEYICRGSNGDTDTENRLGDTVGEGKDGMNEESGIETYFS